MTLHVSPSDLETILEIFNRELPGIEIYAFGSRVSETEPSPEADLDLAIVARYVISVERMVTVERFLAESGLPFSVDVFDYAKLTNKFKNVIDKEHIVIKEAKHG